MSWKDRARPVSQPTQSSGGDWKSRATPVGNSDNKASAFQSFGKALPVVGSTVGGIVGGVGGTVAGFGVGGVPGAIGGSVVGGAAGEAGRQILGRILGEDSPDTSTGALSEIAKEGALGGVGEVTGRGIGKVAGKAFKAFPKFAHGVSGTPAVNIARAQQRGLKVFAPGISREAAGKAQEQVEHPLVAKLFTPEERVLIRAKDAGFADELMKSVMLKQELGQPITAKEAIGLRILAPVKRAADTLRGVRKNVELDKATTGARARIAEEFPELTKRLSDTERAITASQLRKPVPVNKTNPDQINRLFTGLGGLGMFINPKALLGLGAMSPLSMGLAGALMGQTKKSIPKMARRAIQRGSIQTLARILGE